MGGYLGASYWDGFSQRGLQNKTNSPAITEDEIRYDVTILLLSGGGLGQLKLDAQTAFENGTSIDATFDEYHESRRNGDFGDNPGDARMTADGIEGYYRDKDGNNSFYLLLQGDDTPNNLTINSSKTNNCPLCGGNH